jgi:hypothetical protein
LLLAAPEAEARFGKRSRSSSSDSKKDKKVHDATPVGQEDDDDEDEDDDSGSSGGGSSGSYSGGSGSLFVDILFSLIANSSSRHAYVAVSEPESSVYTTPTYEPATVALRLGLDGGSLGGGANLGFFLGLEGRRLGLFVRGTGLTLPTDDGTPGTDSIGLFEANVSYAVWATERGRFRLEAGLSGASAPDIDFLGLNLAASVEACLVGSLDFEARLQGVPLPYRQLDAQAGLAVHLGALSLRGGWRAMVLDDAGHVDGVRHVDAFSGPYLGAGLAF